MEERRLQVRHGGPVSTRPGRGPLPSRAPPPRWPGGGGCRAGSVSVTDRALALRPGVGPPGWGGAGGFPGAAPDAAAAAAAAAASSSLPPKLVMNVIFSSRPGVGERERERDSELDSEGDLREQQAGSSIAKLLEPEPAEQLTTPTGKQEKGRAGHGQPWAASTNGQSRGGHQLCEDVAPGHRRPLNTARQGATESVPTSPARSRGTSKPSGTVKQTPLAQGSREGEGRQVLKRVTGPNCTFLTARIKH